MSYHLSTFWLLLGLLPAVLVNPTSGLLSRLARSNDPSSTDYSGRSLSITLVGSGAPGPIRPLICYTLDTNNVQWIFPDGSPVRLHSSHPSSPAQGSDVFSFDTNDGRGITFNRGPEYLTSGEHCCIRRGTSQRLCVILTVDCGSLTDPENGRVDTSSGTSFLSEATYSCNSGYTPMGLVTRTCTADGQWNSSAPICEAIDCGHLMDPENGHVDTSFGTTFLSEATYSCNSGYTLMGSVTRTCTADGQWNPAAPICEQELFLSLGSTIINNNTEVLITSMSPGEHADTLTCHTDLITCCRDWDNNQMGSLGGEWYYPNGSQVIGRYNVRATEAFYRVRNAPQLVRLVRHHVTSLGPTGSYCCVIPTNRGERAICVNIVMCPSLPPLTNGTISYSDPTLGVDSVASHSCTSFTLVGDATRTCKRNGTWSGSAPYCQAMCDSLPHPKNGFITYNDRLSNSRPTVTEAVYSCSSGYTLNGTATRTCYKNMVWTGSAPTCTAKDCGHPSAPRHGRVELPMGTILNSLAYYSCDDCFRLEGNIIQLCSTDGIWSPAPPICRVLSDCGQLSAPLNGVVIIAPNKTECGSVATYSCNTGYLLKGVLNRTCQVDGQWSDVMPFCSPVDCGSLMDPENGQVDISSGTTFLSEATYSCNSGYTLVGSVTRTCTADGQWNPAAPTCEPVDCGPPTAPQNGHVYWTNTTFNSTATYECTTGYVLHGASSCTCQADRQWLPSPPICEIVDCGPLDHPRNGKVNTDSGTTYNSMAAYSCNEGYYLNGSASRTCMANMEWSSLAPTCDPVNCGPLYGPANGHVDTSQGTLFTSIATYGCNETFNLTGCNSAECLSSGSWSCDPPFCADNAMIQLKFGPTGYCVDWTDWKVNLMYLKMRSLVLRAIHSSGHVIPKENIQQGYFSCYRSTTETTYRTTITGTERVSAVDYADLIQDWVESGVTTRVQWYVIKIDKNCPVSIMSMDDEECV